MIFTFTRSLTTRAALAALSLFFALFANANTAVVIPNADSLLQQAPEAAVLGYEFVASSDLEVTAIGILDEGSNGLSSPHTIAIWDDAGSVVFQLRFTTLLCFPFFPAIFPVTLAIINVTEYSFMTMRKAV